MKKMYAILLVAFALCYSGTAFPQDVFFSAVGARNAQGAAPVTSGTLTTGASLVSGYRNFSQITSFQYGFDVAISTNSGPGGTVLSPGRTQLNAITITKNVDQASNRLMQAGLSGILLSSAQILVTTSDGSSSPRIVHKIDLKNAYITEFTASAGDGCSNGNCVGESFKIVYSAIQVTTYSQSPQGAITQNPPATWNQAGNNAEF